MRRRLGAGAFTLLELLVVVGLVAALSFLALAALRPPRGSALQSGQASVANLLVAARTRASASGQSTRVLVQFDAASSTAPARFLRHLVLQSRRNGAWQSVTDVYLPEGVYVVPGNLAFPTGLLPAAGTAWTKGDGSTLRSTALRSGNTSSESIHAGVTEQWMSVPFAAVGTTNASGDIVLATGRARAPGSYVAGESPVELADPEQVRGLTLSAYGVTTLINSRAGF